MVPRVTSEVGLTSELVMPPNASIILATVVLTASTVALAASPVPWVAFKMLFFTDSITPVVCRGIGHLLSLLEDTPESSSIDTPRGFPLFENLRFRGRGHGAILQDRCRSLGRRPGRRSADGGEFEQVVDEG